MKKIFIMLMICTCTLQAQSLKRQVVGSTGGSYAIGDVRILSTVAQPPGNITISDGINTLRQGFQQPVIDCSYFDGTAEISILNYENCLPDVSFDLAFGGENLDDYTYSWDFGLCGGVGDYNQPVINDITCIDAGEYPISLIVSNGVCSDTAWHLLYVDVMETELTLTHINCEDTIGVADVFISNMFFDGYLFDFGDGFQGVSAQQLEAGDHTVVIDSPLGCVETIDFTINQTEELNLSASIIDAHCGMANGQVTISATGGYEPYSYIWSNGQSGTVNTNYDYQAASNSFVLVSDANDCSDTLYFDVEDVDGPTAIVETTPNYCNQNNGTAAASAEGGVAPYVFEWSTGEQGIFIDGLNEMMVNYLIVTDQNDCTDSISFSVDIQEGVYIFDEIIHDETCVDANNGGIQVDVVSYGPFDAIWSNGVEGSLQINSLEPGEYSVILTDTNNCVDQATYVVEAADSLILSVDIDFESCIDQEGTINVSVDGGAEPYQIVWSNGELGGELLIFELGEYIVEVIDNYGCQDSLHIDVQGSEGNEDCLTIPSGYSPNGDNINDTWFIEGLDFYENSKVKIFNRWGQIVYENSNYLNEWSGEDVHGRELPFGTYYYVLELENESTYSGDVLIKR